MATKIEAGCTSLKRLVEKLGLQGKYVQRVILDIPIRGVATIYVQCVASSDAVDAIADAFVELETGYEVKPVSELSIKPDMTIEAK